MRRDPSRAVPPSEEAEGRGLSGPRAVLLFEVDPSRAVPPAEEADGGGTGRESGDDPLVGMIATALLAALHALLPDLREGLEGAALLAPHWHLDACLVESGGSEDADVAAGVFVGELFAGSCVLSLSFSDRVLSAGPRVVRIRREAATLYARKDLPRSWSVVLRDGGSSVWDDCVREGGEKRERVCEGGECRSASIPGETNTLNPNPISTLFQED